MTNNAIKTKTNVETTDAIQVIDLLLLFLHEADEHRSVFPSLRLASILHIKPKGKIDYLCTM